MKRYRTDARTAATTLDDVTMASEGVLLPIGATGFLMSLMMLAALLA